ncbi:MAG: tetratricopeptide repeat protein [Bryobacterales bacterium]|nr:tetratricopeptide repeat protein [Bryobacterales bacterium]
MKAAKHKPAVKVEPQAQPAAGLWVWLLGCFALPAALAAYWPAVNGPFVFDDEYLPFRDPGFLKTGIRSLSPTARPLMNLSFWLNLRLFGPEPFSYHVINILLHFINTGLAFLAIRKILEMAKVEENRRVLLAVFAAGVFLLHPVQTESVAYVAGRSESFSLLFFLSSFTLFLYKREGGIGWPAAAGVIALFGAAFLSKEHTAVLPALLLWTDWWFAEKRPVEAVRANWRLYAPMAAASVAGMWVVWRVLVEANTAGFGMKNLAWYEYFYTQWRAIWIYLRLFVLPVGLNADYGFPISHSPLEHGSIVGLLGLAALLGAAFYYRKRYPLAFYGLVVFLLLLAPTSSIVPIKDAVAERRLYLPFIGLLLVVCDFARTLTISRGSQLAAAGGILFVLGGLTYGRAAVWSDPVRLWEDTIAHSPGNSRAHFHLAMVYFEQQRYEEALKKFEDAARTGQTEYTYTLLIDWGLTHDALGQTEKALEKFRAAAKIENTAHAHSLIGMCLAKLKEPGAALGELNQAIALDPGYDNGYTYRGNVYRMLNELQRAEEDYRKALAINPGSQAARQNLDAVLRQRGAGR